MNYSQNNEQAVIAAHFASVPAARFLDIGAYDGVKFSNVRRLLDVGWSGVCVEPAPAILPRLYENMAAFAGKVEIVPVAIGTERKTIRFFDSNGDAVSTASATHRDKWKRAGVKFTEAEVDQITPLDLIDRHGDDYAFISIDTEATNAAVVAAMPWERLKACKLVCVEHDNADAAIKATLEPHRYRVIHRNGENLILAR